MSERKPAHIGSTIGLFVGVMATLLVLYVGTSGPLLVASAKKRGGLTVSGASIRVHDPFQLNTTWEEAVYSPLFRVAATAGLNEPLRAYVHFWGAIVVPVCGMELQIIPERPRKPLGAP